MEGWCNDGCRKRLERNSPAPSHPHLGRRHVEPVVQEDALEILRRVGVVDDEPGVAVGAGAFARQWSA